MEGVMDELRERIARVVCEDMMGRSPGESMTCVGEADAILAAIQETHVLVEKKRWDCTVLCPDGGDEE